MFTTVTVMPEAIDQRGRDNSIAENLAPIFKSLCCS
jgi:hypothetical protein